MVRCLTFGQWETHTDGQRNRLLTEFCVSNLENCGRYANQAETDQKGKAKAGIGILLDIGGDNAAQPSNVDHPVYVLASLCGAASSEHIPVIDIPNKGNREITAHCC